MLLAIDYDRTFTRDPPLWLALLENAVQRGHDLVCVTCRSDTPENRLLINGAFAELAFHLPLVFTGHAPKRDAAEHAGYRVDVWIDDVPEVIGAANPGEVATLEATLAGRQEIADGLGS